LQTEGRIILKNSRKAFVALYSLIDESLIVTGIAIPNSSKARDTGVVSVVVISLAFVALSAVGDVCSI
jgi:hypothetical protein